SISAWVTVAKSESVGIGRTRVPIRTLDDLLSDRPQIVDLLKVDTEGAELEILQGAGAVLRRTQRVVLEFHSPELRDGCAKFLKSAGFTEVARLGTILYFR